VDRNSNRLLCDDPRSGKLLRDGEKGIHGCTPAPLAHTRTMAVALRVPVVDQIASELAPLSLYTGDLPTGFAPGYLSFSRMLMDRASVEARFDLGTDSHLASP